jgi:hypothetical protein
MNKKEESTKEYLNVVLDKESGMWRTSDGMLFETKEEAMEYEEVWTALWMKEGSYEECDDFE